MAPTRHLAALPLICLMGVCCLIPQVGDKIEYIKVVDGADNLKNAS